MGRLANVLGRQAKHFGGLAIRFCNDAGIFNYRAQVFGLVADIFGAPAKTFSFFALELRGLALGFSISITALLFRSNIHLVFPFVEDLASQPADYMTDTINKPLDFQGLITFD
jgi:hypothetical protein